MRQGYLFPKVFPPHSFYLTDRASVFMVGHGLEPISGATVTFSIVTFIKSYSNPLSHRVYHHTCCNFARTFSKLPEPTPSLTHSISRSPHYSSQLGAAATRATLPSHASRLPTVLPHAKDEIFTCCARSSHSWMPFSMAARENLM